MLEISDIWPHDAGNYTVVAENPKTGERVETSAPLTVRGDTTSIDRTAFVAPDAFRTLETAAPLRPVVNESGVDTNSFLSPDVLRALDQTKAKPAEAPEKKQPLTAPKVIQPLQPISVQEGQPINFTAKVQGVPQPTVSGHRGMNVLIVLVSSSPGRKTVSHCRSPTAFGRTTMRRARPCSCRSTARDPTTQPLTLSALRIHSDEIKHKPP